MTGQQNWRYQAVAEVIDDPLLGRYRTYGIQASKKTPAGWKPIRLVKDVSTQLQFVKGLSTLFSRYQLSPVHLRDALEDMLP